MDIQHLIQRLEDVIEEGRHMPFSRYTMVDEVRALELIDQLRISVPEEVEKARRIMLRREEILNQAHHEGEQVVGRARERGTEIVEREVTVQVAQNRANQILEEARREAAQLRADADAYVIQVLGKLEQGLARKLSVARNGIQYVRRNGVAAPAVPPATVAENGAVERETPAPALPRTRRIRRARQPQPASAPPAAEAEMVELDTSRYAPPEELMRG